MGLVAVRLDDQPLLHPAEIDRQPADADVGRRFGQVMAATEPEEATLELAARLVHLDVRTSRQAEKVGLPDRSTQLTRRD